MRKRETHMCRTHLRMSNSMIGFTRSGVQRLGAERPVSVMVCSTPEKRGIRSTMKTKGGLMEKGRVYFISVSHQQVNRLRIRLLWMKINIKKHLQ